MIRPIKLSVISFAIVFITACSTAIPQIQYHLLHSVQYKTNDDAPRQDAMVKIALMSLPEYLKGKQMVMQTGPNTLHVSAQNAWAELPERGISRIVAEQLRSKGWLVSAPNRRESAHLIEIEIDDLLPTWQGEVILKGRFTVVKQQDSPKTVAFDHRLNVNQDGYAHAVAQMRESIVYLANQVHQELL